MSTAAPVKPRSTKSKQASNTASRKVNKRTAADELLQELQAQVDAIGKSQAVIEFEMDGTIVTANDNFLNTLGYELEEIQGHHHRMFVDEAYASSPEYKRFWSDLRAGQFISDEFKRIGKGGNEVWIQASYNPIFDTEGNPIKVVKYATDVTESKLRNADYKGQLEAISKSQAVIEFEIDGSIITANQNFLSTLGYEPEEIKGRHHRMFVDEAYAVSAEYKQFWADLRDGKFVAGEFKRIGKGGKEVWIQASYNPIFDMNGKPFKVVKYASDMTQAKAEANENAKVRAMMENMAGSITFADKNNIITYINPAARKLLKEVEQFLQVNVDDITGQSIDVLFKGAQQQRTQPADANNFLFDGMIKVGPESFDLTSSRIQDANGDFAGTLVSWECVTEKLANEQAVRENAEREREQAEELRTKVDSLLTVVDAAAAGNLTVEVTVEGDDAMGQMAAGLRKLLTDLRSSMSSIAENAQTLSTASSELSAVSIEMRSNADNTSNQANVVSSASEGVSENVQSVAASIEEMNASIREISRSASEAANIAGNAVTSAESTNVIVSRLGVSSAEIGKVVKVINSIAEQTNLLALNATIEAARAGEAGKGFAVVANEVKELAKETAKATEDISQRIDAIQADTDGAVKAISDITKIIGQINEASTTIASAVEEQSATTIEIGRSISEASTGTTQIVENVVEVARAAENTMQGAGSAQQAAEELARMATSLQDLVARFDV